jgi:hypothetical protein
LIDGHPVDAGTIFAVSMIVLFRHHPNAWNTGMRDSVVHASMRSANR